MAETKNAFAQWFDEEEVESAEPTQVITGLDDRGVQRTVAPASQIVEAKKSRDEIIDDEIRSLENDLLTESLTTVRDALKARELEEGEDGELVAPEQWVAELGIEGAKQRKRVAQYALLPTSKAPAFLTIAKAVGMGIISARSTEKAGPKSLNMQYVQLVQMPQFKVLQVDDD